VKNRSIKLSLKLKIKVSRFICIQLACILFQTLRVISSITKILSLTHINTSSSFIDGYSTDITSGVTQGSILGPLFFVLFINDLPDVVCSASTIALYADNSKMFRVINCDDDQTLFQNDLDKLYHWSQCNLMDFNSKKCKIMRITKKQVPFTNRVQLSDTVLKEVKEFKV